MSFFNVEISFEDSFCNFFSSSLDSFCSFLSSSLDSFCNFFSSSLDSFCIICDLQSLISKSLDISWLFSNFILKSDIFSSAVFASVSTMFFMAEMPDLCIFFNDSTSSEILFTLHSMPTSRPSKFPMFSFIVSHCLDTSLILLLICCLDLPILDLTLESLWRFSESDEESDDEELLLSVLSIFISLTGSSSSLLSLGADSNSESSSSFTLS